MPGYQEDTFQIYGRWNLGFLDGLNDEKYLTSGQTCPVHVLPLLELNFLPHLSFLSDLYPLHYEEGL